MAVTLSLIFNSLTTKSEPSIGGKDAHSWGESVWPIALVAALTFMVYWRALHYPLLSDDYLIVTYQQNWAGLESFKRLALRRRWFFSADHESELGGNPDFGRGLETGQSFGGSWPLPSIASMRFSSIFLPRS